MNTKNIDSQSESILHKPAAHAWNKQCYCSLDANIVIIMIIVLGVNRP